MKYWRYRMYLLPKEDPAMKKIMEGTAKRCDIYTENKPIPSDKHICNEFIKFVELHLNKIKKVPCKKPRVRNHNPLSSAQLPQRLADLTPNVLKYSPKQALKIPVCDTKMSYGNRSYLQQISATYTKRIVATVLILCAI